MGTDLRMFYLQLTLVYSLVDKEKIRLEGWPMTAVVTGNDSLAEDHLWWT